MAVTLGGESVTPGSEKLRALLAILVIHAREAMSSDRLSDLLWEGEPPRTAAAALQVYVSKLRKALEPERDSGEPALLLVTTAEGYRLDVEDDRIDGRRFERLARRGRVALDDGSYRTAAATLADALRLWQGRPFAGVDHLTEIHPEVLRLEEIRLQAEGDRIDAELALGRTAGHVSVLRSLVEANPLVERFWRQLMLVLYRSDRQADALRAFQEVRGELGEMGIEPGAKLRELEERILLQDPGLDLPTPERTPPSNLQRRLTSFVGRADDLTRVAKMLDESPLVTLTGPGGSGKTRLAVEAAEALLTEFPAGVWMVDLAPISDGARVPHTVAEALSIDSRGGVTEAVVRHLRTKRLLLVIDNCEHLVEAYALFVDRLLRQCPDIKVLVTSRERLGVGGKSPGRYRR